MRSKLTAEAKRINQTAQTLKTEIDHKINDVVEDYRDYKESGSGQIVSLNDNIRGQPLSLFSSSKQNA